MNLFNFLVVIFENIAIKAIIPIRILPKNSIVKKAGKVPPPLLKLSVKIKENMVANQIITKAPRRLGLFSMFLLCNFILWSDYTTLLGFIL